MKSLVNRRLVPLTHASHCVTTSWPAAATQTTVSDSKPSHTHQGIFLCQMPLLPQPSKFPGLETGSEYASLHITEANYN